MKRCAASSDGTVGARRLEESDAISRCSSCWIAPPTGRKCCSRSEQAAKAPRCAECSKNVSRHRSATARIPHRRTVAAGRRAIAEVWDGVPVQRCTVHRTGTLLAHGPGEPARGDHADYNGNECYAVETEEIEAPRQAFIRKWRLKKRAVDDSLEEAGERLFSFTLYRRAVRSVRPHEAIERLHEAFKRRLKSRPCCLRHTEAMWFWALLGVVKSICAKFERLANARNKAHRQPTVLET